MYAEWMKNISLKVTEEDIKEWKEKQKSRRRSKRNGGKINGNRYTSRR